MRRRATDIDPPPGYTFFARRLNRHSYHLFKSWGAKKPLCGKTEEISNGGSEMEYLLAHDSHKRCTDCLALAGHPEQVAEVEAAQAAHEVQERYHAGRMRDALVELGCKDDLTEVPNWDLCHRLQTIISRAEDALRNREALPF